jgi:uncharacterized membrane protein
MSKIHKVYKDDLLIIVIWTIISVVYASVPILGDSFIRTILGIPMVLFIPGYILVAALFPKKKGVDSIERIALSIGLSIAVVPLLGLILNFTFGIRLISVLLSLCVYTIIVIIIVVYRREKLPENERLEYEKNIEERKSKSNVGSIQHTVVDIILIFTIIAAIGMIYFAVLTPKIGEKFTEFYVLNSSGRTDDYQTNLTVGNPAKYIVGVSNHEYDSVNYTIEIAINKNVLTSKNLTLEHNQTFENNMTLVLDKKGTDMKLEFWLFKEKNFTAPYRELHLWVNSI